MAVLRILCNSGERVFALKRNRSGTSICSSDSEVGRPRLDSRRLLALRGHTVYEEVLAITLDDKVVMSYKLIASNQSKVGTVKRIIYLA